MVEDPARMTVSRLANVAARSIFDGFRKYRRKFSTITRRAPKRFRESRPQQLLEDTRERIDLYDDVVGEVVGELREMLGERLTERVLWIGMKAVYSGMLADRGDWDLAETFYNSVTRRIFTTVGVDQEIEFALTDFDTPPTPSGEVVFRVYEHPGDIRALMERILSDRDFGRPFADLSADAARVAGVLEERLRERGALLDIRRAEIMEAVFYRNDGAFLIGRLFAGSIRIPIVIALECAQEEGVTVDGVLFEENDISILFSFTRSYFHVETKRPYDLVRYLKLILPSKRLAECYISLGFDRHGKTELFRDMNRQLRTTTDRFELAPGKPGTVMVVFTLPSYDLVFKVIRDRFPETKRMTPDDVAERYQLVFEHDRAGRLVDTQVFKHLTFGADRFSERLLEVLHEDASASTSVDGDRMVLHRVFVQRRVTPLDLYVRHADPHAAQAAIIEFGNAIKDLARANVFAGDLFLKNFGVTRHGRVVFYDYDELTLLTDVRFRRMPEPRTYEDAISDQPWFTVDDHDVFPEEFLTFLGLPPWLQKRLRETHGELFHPAFWQETQRQIREGHVFRAVPHRARVAG